jgi:hypothetical protein
MARKALRLVQCGRRERGAQHAPRFRCRRGFNVGQFDVGFNVNGFNVDQGS